MTAPPGTAPPGARWELLRALAAVVDTSPRRNGAVVQALGLPALDPAEHTRAFVLSCPPYASLYLGPEGKLGGVGADRVAGFWRTLGLTPPSEPDHLAALLVLYAELAGAAQEAGGERAREALTRARAALFGEHLWSWAPAYLTAVADLDGGAVPRWAELTRRALRREAREIGPSPVLPLALREAPGPLGATLSPGEILDTVLAPVRGGLLLTHRTLSGLARQAGMGYRAGERRFALGALLEQDPRATLTGLAAEARAWVDRHRAAFDLDPATAGWWASRAEHTAGVLAALPAAAPPR